MFDNIIPKNNLKENQCREIKKRLRSFISTLVEKSTGLYRILKNAIKIDWTVKFYCPTTTIHNAGRPTKEFAE